MKVKAFLRPYKDKEEAPVYVWYTHKTKYFPVPLGLSVLITKWNKKKGYAIGDDLTNLQIEKTKSELLECAKRILLSGLDPTIDLVKAQYKAGSQPILYREQPTAEQEKPTKKETSFTEMLDLYLEHNKSHIEPGTLKQRKAFVSSMKLFAADKKYDLQFSQMTEAFYSTLAHYYLYEKDNYNNFFGSIIKRLKTFLKWCADEMGVAVNPAFRKFKIYTEEKEIVYFTPKELTLLYNHNWDKGRRKYVDLFVLACDTGFRISDVFRSRLWKIEDGIIYTTTKKTKGSAKVPVSERMLEILNRYGFDMRIATEQAANKAIKQCLKEVGVDENVIYRRYKLREEFEFTALKSNLTTLHCGRRSFITNSFANGYTESEILEMIGSKDAKILKIYLKIEASSLKDKMVRSSLTLV
ncbi:phage integrase SAM-like domain-containing protein [uncultured Pontibacter sp.]|uniref:tyrosine-type recombinase/integrase n=1 Tax=uncultured Pontibacter sp. TaxID=453356 RepID=UPI002613DFEE|nr:phage integrase SAM-like domain-containing protein [uncultured Pontibacter sp.]